MNDKNPSYGRGVVDPAEIATILQIAKSHLWQFSFYLPDKSNRSPFSTEILRVDPKARTVVFGPEVNTLAGPKPRDIRFRASNGGIGIQFDSQIIQESSAPNAHFYASSCKIRMPERLVYAQQRQAVRVNFSNLAEIPITLFTGDGHHISGLVEDISESGVKARFSGYLVEKFDNNELIADCGLILPGRTEIQGKVQVLGTLYDFQEDVSFVRCAFTKLSGSGPLRIRALIEKAQKKTESSSPV